MVIVGTFLWWYSAGLRSELVRSRTKLASIYDFFSIDLLLKTLFSPFRQISAGSVRGPIGVQLRAWLDNLFSRAIGAIVRSFMIVFGSLTLALSGIVATLRIMIWIGAPALPLVGIILWVSGFVPWTL